MAQACIDDKMTKGMAAKRNGNHFFGQILATYVLSRLVLVGIGYLSTFYFPSARSILPITDLKYHTSQPTFLEIWARWDSEWYILIAEKGYDSYESFKDYGHGRYLPQDIAKFFPAFPLAVRYLSLLTRNTVLAGILISNLSAVIFLFFFYKLASKLYDSETGLRGALFYIVFPTSFFLSAVYSESLFLAALLAAFFYLEEKRLLPAGIASALAVLTRPQALLAIPALLWLAWRNLSDRRAVAIALLSVSVVLPLLLYLIFFQQEFGSYRWAIESQRHWRGELRYPLYALIRFAQSNIAIHGQHNSLIDFSFASLNLLVLVFSVRKLPGPYYLYSMMAVLFPLSSTLFSFSRLCLANFPFFLFLGNHLSGRWAFTLQIVFSMLLAFFMAGFANWYWVA